MGLQKIETPKRYRAWDTSGNNNHGQIYSGRGLEFDGVTDYLDLGADTQFIDFSDETEQSKRAWTIACWINFDEAKANHQAVCGGSGSIINYLCLGAPEKLAIYDIDNSAWRYADTVLNPQTWYRAVWAFNGDAEITFYVNGVADGTGVIGTNDNDNSDLELRYVGVWSPSQADPRYWEGKLSDFQAWQGEWTADDVAFDYANPEQLALNRGGTTLQENNLKLWYPMDDGHRGQQSYVLDASNTGLGDELLTNGDFSDATSTDSSVSALAGWTNGGTHDSSNKWTISDGQLTCTSDGTDSYMTQAILTAGVTYKITLDYVSGDTDVRWHSGSSLVSISTVGTHTIYHTAVQTNIAIDNGASGTFTIDNLSIKPVNDKNHATTVFYGDMTDIVTDSDAEFGKLYNTANTLLDFTAESTAFSGGDGYNVISNSAFSSIGSTATALIETDNSSTGLEITNLGTEVGSIVGEWTGVIGRNYKVEVEHYDTSESSFVDANLLVTLGTTQGGTQYVLGESEDGSFSHTFTATSTQIHFGLGVYSIISSHAVRIKTVQIREVGTAAGWTDADQQLDIPQTALQSYNQLMFFQGQEDSTADRVLINPTTSIFNQSVGDYNSISSWVWFGNDFSTDTTSGMPWAVTGSKPNFFYTISGSDIQIGYNTGNGDVVGVQLPYSYFTGKWTHFVINWRISTSSEVPNDSDLTDPAYIAYIPEFFINGEKQSLSYVSGVNSNSCPTSGTADIHIGDNTNNYAHVGSVTEFSTWTKKLSQAEVEELYNDGKALDATLHSAADDDLTGYWRNNGLADWSNIVNPGTNDATIEQGTETFIQQAGVDASRDCQGFLMNRQKDTNALNLTSVVEDGEAFPGHDYARMTNALLNDDIFSASLWIKTAHIGQYQYLFDNRDSTDSGWVLYIHPTDNTLRIKIGDASDTATLSTGTAIVINEWTHFAVTYAGSAGAIKLYQNGVYKATANATDVGSMASAITTAPNIPGYGFTSGVDANGVNGMVDEVLYYDKVLSDGGVSTTETAKGEIARIYKAGKRSHR